MLRIWIISLICISLMVFLNKMVLPEGKTAKASSFVFAVIMMICLIKPLTLLGVDNTQYNFMFYSDDTIAEKNEEYKVNFAKKYYFLIISNHLKKREIVLKKARFELDMKNGEIYIKKIIINRADLEYLGVGHNNNIMSLTRDVIAEFTGLEKKYVVIDE